MKRASRLPIGQEEFGFAVHPLKAPLQIRPPYRLRLGDIVYFDKRICPIVRISESAAVIALPQPCRDFTTIWGKSVHIRPKPRLVRIAANSEVLILKRRKKGGSL